MKEEEWTSSAVCHLWGVSLQADRHIILTYDLDYICLNAFKLLLTIISPDPNGDFKPNIERDSLLSRLMYVFTEAGNNHGQNKFIKDIVVYFYQSSGAFDK